MKKWKVRWAEEIKSKVLNDLSCDFYCSHIIVFYQKIKCCVVCACVRMRARARARACVCVILFLYRLVLIM
jgi:hypothetical protein